MAIRPCPTKVDCPGFINSPVLNNSSEAPDPLTFLTLNFGDPYFPPLNSNFTASNCFETCESTVSQLDADLCAARDAFICQHTDPVTGHAPPLYYSFAGTGTVLCPDGNPFTYSVRAGLFVALTQNQANLEAGQLALQLARINKVCLGSIQTYACLKQAYSSGIMATGRDTIPNFPDVNTWELISGSLPPGLTLHTGSTGNTCAIDGTPTAAGSYTFQVRFTNPLGSFMTKTFTICATDITASPANTCVGSPANSIPDGAVGASYLENFTSSTCATATLKWSVTAGALPAGLTLNADTGALTGTPTAMGSYDFTVSLGVCSKEFTMTVNPPPRILSEYWKLDESGNATRVGSAHGIGWTAFFNTTSAPGLFGNAVVLNTGPTEGGLFGPSQNSLRYNAAASNGVSLFFWFKLLANASNNTANSTISIECLDSVNPQDSILYATVGPLGVANYITLFHTNYQTNETAFVTSPFNPTIGSWHLICLTWDNLNHTLNLYIDGALAKSTPDSITPFQTCDTGTMNALNSGVGANTFAWLLDEVGLSLVGALSCAQVAALYNSGSGMTYPAVLAVVPLA